jgi:flavin-dependent dehydrogenase
VSGRDGHAVVIGAGIAGLMAARVLTETFAAVTVLDRDALTASDERRGVPQGHHLHGLMDRGRSIMDDLFPGLVDELISRGASTTEVLVGSRWYLGGLRTKPTPTGLTSVLASRPLLESVLRDRTAALPGVRSRSGMSVTGLVPAPDGPARVAGVRARATAAGDATAADAAGDAGDAGDAAGEPGGPEETIAADLVVDASGRGSRAYRWLAELGHEPPETERVDVDLGYASRLYRRRPGDLGGAASVIVGMTPGRPGGGAVAVEGGRWLVTLAGMLGNHPPREAGGFESFAAALPVPDVADLIRGATPLTEPVPYRFRGSLRRRYEMMADPPDGFVVIGDALCGLNPLYAQGMTVAAQQALALRECLRDGAGARDGLPRRFYRTVAPLVDVAWEMSTAADLRYPGVAGRRGARWRLTSGFSARAQTAAHRDPVVARRLIRVINLVDPPTSLMRPDVAARILARG